MEYSIGGIGVRAFFDPETKMTTYSVGSAEFHSEQCPSVALAMAQFASMLEKEGDVVNRPFTATPRFSRSAREVIEQAKPADWEGLRAMMPLDAAEKGVSRISIVRAGTTPLGDALFSVVELPEEVRETVLPEGVRVTGKFSPEESAHPQLITAHVNGQQYEYAVVKTRAGVLSGGRMVMVQVFMIASASQWEDLGIRRSERPEYALGSYTELVREFVTKANADFDKLPDEDFDGHDLEADVSRLLAYCAGVVRWLVNNDYSHDGEKVNPWYALGLTLLTNFGLKDGEEIFAFGRSVFDDLRAIEGTDVPSGMVTSAQPNGSVN